ncbi:MAG TPA: hypothetical protein VH307_29830 [Streptosporangiaceae bacterium]|nr:hypothetical protein [Streptosporangiaceae bacterium]
MAKGAAPGVREAEPVLACLLEDDDVLEGRQASPPVFLRRVETPQAELAGGGSQAGELVGRYRPGLRADRLLHRPDPVRDETRHEIGEHAELGTHPEASERHACLPVGRAGGPGAPPGTATAGPFLSNRLYYPHENDVNLVAAS